MSKASVLIVEDEQIVAADLASKLSRLGYQVSGTTARGEDAITMARDLRPALVLMDIRLAGAMDGVEAAELIRREYDLPVIYLTAHSDRATLQRAKLTEPFGYILKPFEELELETHLEMALYKHQAERKLRESHDRLEAHVAQRTVQLRQLAAQLTRAEELERRRVAEVLHEGLQQMLVGAMYNLQGIFGMVKDPALQLKLLGVHDILKKSVEISRSLTHELSPPILRQSNFGDVLNWLSRWFKEKHGLTVEVEILQPVEVAEEEVRVMLYRSVLELLFNVIKHAQVETARVRLSHGPEETVQIEVSDEGVGFESKPTRVEPGASSSRGFGLFHLRERLDLLGGCLKIKSAPGHGSQFVLTIPMPDSPGSLGLKTPDLPVLPAGVALSKKLAAERKIRVLLADDHPIIRDGLIRLIQEQADMTVVGQAGDGLEAVSLARHLLPDIVLMDAIMPQLSGIEATQLLRSELPQIKVIGMSMFEEEAPREAMGRAGAVAFLSKSGPTTELLRMIRNCDQAGRL